MGSKNGESWRLNNVLYWNPIPRTMTTRIGDFLVQIGAMKPEQVQQVLRLQQAGDARRFGEIAHALGHIGDDSLKRYVEYLEKQNLQSP